VSSVAGRRPGSDWVSVSDLSEYAYCPRAFWYRHHPPTRPPTPATERSRAAGTRFHQRRLTADERSERWGAKGITAVLIVAAAIAALALWLWWV
jgi:CRISPR/Cas system-associated exonuclease Cas4 (RecB family)